MQGPWLVAFIVQWVVVIMLMLVVIGILRQLAVLEQKLSSTSSPDASYEVGQRIADFELPDVTGDRLHSNSLLARGERTVLLFISSSCPACGTLLAEISEILGRPNLAMERNLLVIALGVDSAARLLEANAALRSSQVVVLSDIEGSVFRQFRVNSVPTGLVVDRNGQVADVSLNPHVGGWLYEALDLVPSGDLSQGGPVGIVTRVASQKG